MTSGERPAALVPSDPYEPARTRMILRFDLRETGCTPKRPATSPPLPDLRTRGAGTAASAPARAPTHWPRVEATLDDRATTRSAHEGISGAETPPGRRTAPVRARHRPLGQGRLDLRALSRAGPSAPSSSAVRRWWPVTTTWASVFRARRTPAAALSPRVPCWRAPRGPPATPGRTASTDWAPRAAGRASMTGERPVPTKSFVDA